MRTEQEKPKKKVVQENFSDPKQEVELNTTGEKRILEPGDNLETAISVGLVDKWNKFAEEENLRAEARYGKSWLGKARRWLESSGTFKKIDLEKGEGIESIGQYQENAKWKKFVKPIVKIAGGVGMTATMVMTGAGMFTPALFGLGLRETYSGAIELAQKGIWGGKWASMEVDAQQNVAKLYREAADKRVGMDLETFNDTLDAITASEDQAVARETLNTTSEGKQKLFRSYASSILSVGTGILTGVPMGVRDLDGGATWVTRFGGKPAEQMIKVLSDESHRTMWNPLLKDHFNFLYNAGGEAAKAGAFAAEHGMKLTQITEQLGNAWGVAHTTGGEMGALVNTLWGAGAALVGRTIMEAWKPKKRPTSHELTLQQEKEQSEVTPNIIPDKQNPPEGALVAIRPINPKQPIDKENTISVSKPLETPQDVPSKKSPFMQHYIDKEYGINQKPPAEKATDKEQTSDDEDEELVIRTTLPPRNQEDIEDANRWEKHFKEDQQTLSPEKEVSRTKSLDTSILGTREFNQDKIDAQNNSWEGTEVEQPAVVEPAEVMQPKETELFMPEDEENLRMIKTALKAFQPKNFDWTLGSLTNDRVASIMEETAGWDKSKHSNNTIAVSRAFRLDQSKNRGKK